MIRFSFLLLFLCSIPAFAGLEIGKYKGVDHLGVDCFITVNQINYVGGQKHPVNFRALVQTAEGEMTLQHRLAVDFLQQRFGLEKVALVGESNGDGKKIVKLYVEMDSSSDESSPRSYHLARLHLPEGQVQFSSCRDLKHF